VKLAVAALIRNESDIIGVFLQHLDALFDCAILMDHGSIDCTDRAIAAALSIDPTQLVATILRKFQLENSQTQRFV
jgi:hypothetical protein